MRCQFLSELQVERAGAVLDGGQKPLDLSEEHREARLGIADDLMLLLVAEGGLGLGEQAGQLEELDDPHGDLATRLFDGVVESVRALDQRVGVGGGAAVATVQPASEFKDYHVGSAMELVHQSRYFWGKRLNIMQTKSVVFK